MALAKTLEPGSQATPRGGTESDFIALPPLDSTPEQVHDKSTTGLPVLKVETHPTPSRRRSQGLLLNQVDIYLLHPPIDSTSGRTVTGLPVLKVETHPTSLSRHRSQALPLNQVDLPSTFRPVKAPERLTPEAPSSARRGFHFSRSTLPLDATSARRHVWMTPTTGLPPKPPSSCTPSLPLQQVEPNHIWHLPQRAYHLPRKQAQRHKAMEAQRLFQPYGRLLAFCKTTRPGRWRALPNASHPKHEQTSTSTP